MGYYIAPGVKFREIDLSEYAPALSTSTCGIIGTCTKGPINTATFITSAEQFVKIFGNPTPDSYMPYAALQFLERGRSLWVVRVCGGSADGSPYTSAAKAQAAITGAASKGSVTGANSEYFTITAATGATVTGTETENFVISTGVNDKIKITGTGVTGDIITGATIAAGSYTAAQLAALLNAASNGLTFADSGSGTIKCTLNTTGASASFVVVTIATNMYTTIGWSTYVGNTYTGVNGTDYLSISVNGGASQTLSLTAGIRSASQVASEIDAALTGADAAADNLGRVRVETSVTGSTKTIQIEAASTADTPLGFDNSIHTGTDGGSTTFTCYANSEGTWSNGYKVVITNADATAETFDLSLTDANDVSLETYLALSKDSSSTYFHETILANESNYITSTDVSAVSSVPVDGTYTLAAGANGMSDVVDADFVGTYTTSGTKTGLEIFNNPNEIAISILLAPGETEEPVQNKLISICEVNRRDCIAVLDTPDSLTVQQAVNFMNGEGGYSARASLNSSYGCLYWSWIKVYDPYNPTSGNDSDGYIWVPPSGFVAAQMAYTDYVADPWFPPAGPQRGRLISALGIRYNPNDGDIGLMYGTPNNLNAIVERDGIIQIFGQKTLQRATTSRDRVATRRMLNYAERIVTTSATQILFDPNDEITWRRFVRLVSPIFDTIKDRRGLYDFRVVCDESTNTADLIAQNTMAGKILMQHMKYSEIIQIDFVSTPTGINFSEVEY